MTKLKPREYFILDTAGNWPKAFRQKPAHADPKNVIPVIEKSAFDKAVVELSNSIKVLVNCYDLAKDYGSTQRFDEVRQTINSINKTLKDLGCANG